MQFLPEQGLILLGDDRKLLMDANAMGLLRKEIVNTLGIDLGRGLFVRYGFRTGFEDAMSLAQTAGQPDDITWLQAWVQLRTIEGKMCAEFDSVEIDRQAGHLRASGTWDRSFEAEQHKLHFGISSRPACWTQVGYVSGYASAVLGRQVICRELACQGMGDEICRWEMRLAEEWHGEADEMIRDLEMPVLAQTVVELYERERRLNRQLQSLRQATLAISSGLSLHDTLQRIVEAARQLAGAQYAALAIPNEESGGIREFLTTGLSEHQRRLIGHPPVGRGVLGALLYATGPVRIPRLEDDSRSAGFPPNHPPMSTFLGVPIRLKGHTLGTLYLTNKIGAPMFTEEDEQLIVMLAAHAAVAIENARLYEQVERLAVLEERERFSMDLHDGVIQEIYGVGLRLASSLPLIENDPAALRAQLSQAIEGLNDAIADIRTYIRNLQQPLPDVHDLHRSLAHTVRDFHTRTGVPVDLQTEAGTDIPLNDHSMNELLHIVREALTNASKHAKATHLLVRLERTGEQVQVIVEDDGSGFIPVQRARAGHGLRNMQARAHALGGELEIDSQPGLGTRVKIQIPIQ